MKLKNKEQRSLWYKKIFYYLKSGQSLSESVRVAATDISTMYIYEELTDGVRFSDVCMLPDVRNIFTQTEVSLLRIAEQTGTMQSVCAVLSRMLKEQHEQSQRLVAAMIYPILVLFMACGLLLMILFVVVPKIGPLFSSMKNMPVATKILLVASRHIVNFWWADLVFVSLCISLLVYIKYKTKYFAHIKTRAEKLFIYIPYIRDIYILWFIERWVQITYLSLQSKTSLVQAFSFAHDSVSDVYIKTEFEKVTQHVRDGNSCFDSLNSLDGVLRRRMQDWISVIASGEKTGTLEEVFKVSHEHISSNLKESFDRFQKVIEPLLIILVGVMVLGICLAIILPMYQLTQSIQ